MKTWRLWLVSVFAALCLAGTASAQATAGPRVDGFDVEEVTRLAPGTALRFTLSGTPGAAATLRIDGAPRTLALAEVEPGLYEGVYVVDGVDRIAPDARVTADLRLGHRVASAVLEEPLVLGAVVSADARACRDCGVVQAVQAVEVPVEPGVVGLLAGSVVGAIIGNQVGRGDGRTAARILGAVGGAYAGREIERAHRQRTHYDVVLRLDDGSVQRRRYSTAPPFRAGDRVKIVQDRWLRDTDPELRRAAAAF
jgi:outer membrane lipoprotein SlyB